METTFILAELARPITSATLREHGTGSSADPQLADRPIVEHRWGSNFAMKAGRAVYVEHQPAGEFAETWSLYFDTGHVLRLNTVAARLFLRSRRGQDGRALLDTTGRGQQLHDRFWWEMNR